MAQPWKTRRNTWKRSTALFFLAGWLLPAALTQTTIQGHVRYRDGSPVRGARVEFIPFAAYSGILPEPGVTNDNGEFRLTFPSVGEGWLTASKVNEGFPDAAQTLYGRGGYESVRSIDLHPNQTVTADLQFGSPNATVEVEAVDSHSGKPISTARILIEWPDNSENMVSETIPSSGRLLLVLPRHPVTMVVTAPGYLPWKYRDSDTLSSGLQAEPGSQIHLQVGLTPK